MAKKPGGLGRDFYAILDDNITDMKEGAATTLRIAEVEPRSDQPRKQFDKEALEALADSIASHGVLQPILVRQNPNFEGYFEIIAGERRWRAAKMAGLTEIPAIVLDGDDLKVAQIAVIENVQREDLNVVEEAIAYKTLMDQFDLTQDQISKQVGKSRPAIANLLRLLELPDEVLEQLKAGDLTAGHARALLGLDDEAQIVDLAQKIVEKDYSVRETERIVRLFKAKADADEAAEDLDESDAQRKVYMKDLERRVMHTLGRKVRIARVAKKKIVELSYEDDQDLEEIIKMLCGNDFFAEI